MKYRDCGECPRCGSLRTGRFLEKISNNETKTKLKYLKRGELIRFRNEYTPKEYNCFCDDCDTQWFGEILTYSITDEELEEIFEEKEILGNEAAKIDEINKTFKKERRKKKVKGFVQWFLPSKHI